LRPDISFAGALLDAYEQAVRMSIPRRGQRRPSRRPQRSSH
jgi:hypothetical protein